MTTDPLAEPTPPGTLPIAGGAAMPALGLGTWLSEPGLVGRAVRHALEVGYRHIDCAWIYGNEAEVGQAIREAIAAGVVDREQLWITSKLWNDHHAPEHVAEGLEASRQALGLDVLDLYLIHWPVAQRHGIVRPSAPADLVSRADLPLARTWEAMGRLVAQGKVRHVGVSNFSLAKIDEITRAVGVAPAANQIELHPLLAQPTLVAGLAERGIAAIAYAPLGSAGRPPGLRRADEPDLLTHPVVLALARAHQATPAQILLAWALARGTAPIPKSTTPARIEENLGALALSLGPADRAALDALDRGTRLIDGRFWCLPGGPYTYEDLWA